MNFIPTECTARSLGPASQLTTLLIQTLVSSYCSISKTNMWPKDFGEKVKDGGYSFSSLFRDNKIILNYQIAYLLCIYLK